METANQKKRRKMRDKALRVVNAKIWFRDSGKCIVCDSKKIQGVPYKSGGHHILGRTHRGQLLEEMNICLLCVACHENANTKTFAKKLMVIMAERYNYKYTTQPYAEIWFHDGNT